MESVALVDVDQELFVEKYEDRSIIEAEEEIDSARDDIGVSAMGNVVATAIVAIVAFETPYKL